MQLHLQTTDPLPGEVTHGLTLLPAAGRGKQDHQQPSLSECALRHKAQDGSALCRLGSLLDGDTPTGLIQPRARPGRASWAREGASLCSTDRVFDSLSNPKLVLRRPGLRARVSGLHHN